MVLEIIDKEKIKDESFLLEAHGYDSYKWQITNARSTYYNVQKKGGKIVTLYYSRITVKPVEDFVWDEERVQKLFNNIKTNYKNKLDVAPKQQENNGNILIVPIADFHYGLLSDNYSTGNEYNLEIAEELFYYTLNDVLHRIKGKTFEKVLFVVGNDFINADNLSGTTTRGTPQDNTGLWFSIVDRATQLIVDGIDMLTEVAPVDVLYVPSNHDLHTMFGVMQTLKAWYRNSDNVTIDDSPLDRKYYQFGEALLPFSHNIKVKEALKIISSEAKNQWSESKHVICMLAHLHQAMVYDKQGYLEILRLPTISGWSRWTNSMGYVQTEKKNQSFIVNKKLGITDTMNTIIV